MRMLPVRRFAIAWQDSRESEETILQHAVAARRPARGPTLLGPLDDEQLQPLWMICCWIPLPQLIPYGVRVRRDDIQMPGRSGC